MSHGVADIPNSATSSGVDAVAENHTVMPRNSATASARASPRRVRIAAFTIGSSLVPSSMEIPYIKRTAANGLDVIVHEHPSTADVLRSPVGTTSDRRTNDGPTGFAHLFEL